MVRWKMGPWMMSLVTSARGNIFPFFPTGHGRKSRKNNPRPRMKECPHKRGHFKRNFHLPTINFQGDVLVFKGVEAEWNGIEAWIRSLSPIFCILAMLGLGGAMTGSGYGLQKFRDPQNELELVYFGCLGYFEKKGTIGYFCWVVWIWSVFFAFLCQAVWWHQQVLWRNPEVWKEYLSNCLDDQTDDAFFWQGNDVGVFQVTMMMLGYDVSFLVVEVCEHLVSVTCFIVFYDVPSNFASRSVCSPLAAPYFCFLLLENFVARQFFLYQVQLSPHHHLPGGFFMWRFSAYLPNKLLIFINWTHWGFSALQEAGKSSSWGTGNPSKGLRFSHQNYLEQKSCFFPLNMAAKALENCCLGDDPFLLERQALRGYVSLRGGISFTSMTEVIYHSSRVTWFHWKWITEGEDSWDFSIIFSLYPLQKLTNVTLKIPMVFAVGIGRRWMPPLHWSAPWWARTSGSCVSGAFRVWGKWLLSKNQPTSRRQKEMSARNGRAPNIISSPKKDSKQKKGAKHPMFLFMRQKW